MKRQPLSGLAFSFWLPYRHSLSVGESPLTVLRPRRPFSSWYMVAAMRWVAVSQFQITAPDLVRGFSPSRLPPNGERPRVKLIHLRDRRKQWAVPVRN